MDGNHARALLGLPEHATTGQISRAFRGAAFVAHPDRGGDPRSFRALVHARDLLLAQTPAVTSPSIVPAASPSGSSSVTGVRHPFLDLTAPAGRSTMSVVDIDRPAPPSPPAPTATPDFEDVLASVLADAA